MSRNRHKLRTLKIHTRYRAKKFGHTTMPEIRLMGHWLSKLGFEQGKCVKVTSSFERLVIEVDHSYQALLSNQER